MVSLSSLAQVSSVRMIPAESMTRLGSLGVVAAGLMAIVVFML